MNRREFLKVSASALAFASSLPLSSSSPLAEPTTQPAAQFDHYFLTILDGDLKDRRFVAGDRYTVADITGLVCIDFMKPAKLAVPETLANLKRWHAEVSARPSAQA